MYLYAPLPAGEALVAQVVQVRGPVLQTVEDVRRVQNRACVSIVDMTDMTDMTDMGVYV